MSVHVRRATASSKYQGGKQHLRKPAEEVGFTFPPSEVMIFARHEHAQQITMFLNKAFPWYAFGAQRLPEIRQARVELLLHDLPNLWEAFLTTSSVQVF